MIQRDPATAIAGTESSGGKVTVTKSQQGNLYHELGHEINKIGADSREFFRSGCLSFRFGFAGRTE
jgi:hypothetical protein